MLLAQTPDGLREASKGARACCPSCAAIVRPKCGPIVTWHWAHLAKDCDPWSEPETAWHLGWKRFGFEAEAIIRRNGTCHRADIRRQDGTIIELQSHYLNLEAIRAREQFYGQMVWLYRVTWAERLHWGSKGFWWKHGSKAMAQSTRPIYWDVGDGIWKVNLSLVRDDSRVVGWVNYVLDRPQFARWIGGAPQPLSSKAPIRALVGDDA